MATKIILARILFPEDFGIFALATGLIGFASAFGNFGLDFALIQRADTVGEDDFQVALSLRWLISIVLLAVTLGLAMPWSALFGNPSIGMAAQGLAIVYLVAPLGFVPATKLMARLEYRRLIVPNVLTQIANSGVALSLAMLGFHFWSLVGGMVISQCVWVLSVSLSNPWSLRFRFDMPIAKSLLGYSRHLMFASVLAFLMTNVDNLTVGYLLGSSILGYYAVAYSLCLLSSMVSGSAATVLLPSLSKIKHDLQRLRSGYLESFGYASATIAPIAIGLAVMSPEIVTVLLGAPWRPSILPLVVLSSYGFAKAMVEFASPLFATLAQPRAIPRLNLFILVGSVGLLFPLTLTFGITGTAIAMSIPMFAGLAISIWWSARVLDVQLTDFAVRLKGPGAAAVLSGSVAVVSKWCLSWPTIRPFLGSVSDLVVLVVATLAGALTYLGSLSAMDSEVYKGLRRHLRLILPSVHV